MKNSSSTGPDCSNQNWIYSEILVILTFSPHSPKSVLIRIRQDGSLHISQCKEHGFLSRNSRKCLITERSAQDGSNSMHYMYDQNILQAFAPYLKPTNIVGIPTVQGHQILLGNRIVEYGSHANEGNGFRFPFRGKEAFCLPHYTSSVAI